MKQKQKQLISVMVILLVMPLINAYVCQDETEQQYIPCEVISDTELDCSTNATIFSVNNSLINMSTEMGVKDETTDRRNLSFGYSDLGTYRIDLCDDAYAYIDVISDQTFNITNNLFEGGGVSFKTAERLTKHEIKEFAEDFWIFIRDKIKLYGFYTFMAMILFIGIIKRKKKVKANE